MKQLTCKPYGITVALPLLLLLFACSPKEAPEALPAKPQTKLVFSDAQRQLANIMVAEVATGTLGNQLLLTGILKIDEQSVVSISSGIAGRIEKLYFKNTGETVNKGDPLYEFYSEELLAIQREYKALEDNNWNYVGKSDRTIAIENKLLLLGMLPSQVEQLKKINNFRPVVTIYSSHQGIIRSVNVTEGQYFNVGQQIYGLADDSNIWAEAQVYPNELQSLSAGMPADVIVPGAGDLHIHSKIAFINPAFESGSNVTLVRVVISNPGRVLYPGMHALISVQSQKSKGIVIPASAVLIEKEGNLVWIENDDGSFSSRIVTTGLQSSDSVMVVSGLKAAERIAVSGVYLINSEKKLNSDTQTSTETKQ